MKIGKSGNRVDGSRQTTDFPKNKKSARRGSNPRPPPWQGGAPPLSHSRIIQILNLLLLINSNQRIQVYLILTSVSIFFTNFLQFFCNIRYKRPTHLKISLCLYYQKSSKNRPPCESGKIISPFTRQSFYFN